VNDINDIVAISPLIPVVVIDDSEQAIPLAELLVEEGMPIIEVTLRTPQALDAIEQIAARVPDIILGAGTVTTPEQVASANNAGSEFIVSPGISDTMAMAIQQSDTPWLPGTASASDIIKARQYGHKHCKLFPAEAIGGLPLLKALSAPFPEMQFCPTGGISLENANHYLELPMVPCIGGSWIATQEDIQQQRWTVIRQRIQLFKQEACGY